MILLYIILYIIGWFVGLYGLFKKAGFTPWKALIPYYNTWIMVEKTGVKKIWFWLQFIPIVGQFISIWILIIFVMNFGKFGLVEHTLAVLVPFIYLPYLANSKDGRWIGPEGVKHYKKGFVREWIDALVFAVVAATITRTFIFEAYVIPTGSMEKTLLINDYLYVNKMSYGARIPETPLSFPLVHNFMPGSVTTPSYLTWIKLPYKRLPALSEIKRNDVVVFNFPAGDTIINEIGYGSALPYYDVLREEFKGNREALAYRHPNILVHPRDKTDSYIKRCTAIPGDTIYIKNGNLWINNQLAEVPAHVQMPYLVQTNGQPFSHTFLTEDINIKLEPTNQTDSPEFESLGSNIYRMTMRKADVEKLKKQANVLNITVDINQNSGTYIFPNDTAFHWTIDNFGPLYIPKKGHSVTLSKDNISIYRRLITNYEENTLEEKNGQFFINGEPTNTYTFKYNYYWMMGDNRHRSQDSRYWGFVPETHIVGKASFVWFSWQNGPRWNRIFSAIK